MLIPDWPQIEEFPTPLEPGERIVLEAYERLDNCEESNVNLDIYVQPYLENYRPDVVVCIPENGILIIEVKDWKPESKTTPNQGRAAMDQAKLYRDQIISLCSPNISKLLTNPEFAAHEALIMDLIHRAVTVAVAVPFLEQVKVNRLFQNKSVHIMTREAIKENTRLLRPSQLPNRLPPDMQRAVVAEIWQSLKSWLTPPYHRAEQGRLSKSDLTKAQRPHASPRGPGWYRLRGPAGSGKSLILAHKAALMASEGKKVLVVCFNITLTHYLRDLIAQMRYDFSWEHVVIRHFHALLKEIRIRFEVCFTKDEIALDSFLNEHYPKVVAEILNAHPDHPFQFDAILIDEGQDFQVNWFQILGQCLTQDGEMLLVRDRHQNVYGKDLSWSDGDKQAIRGLKSVRGFSGKWAELGTTWRMSPTITGGVSEFALRQLGADPFNVDVDRSDQKELYQGSTFCRWENVQQQDVDTRLLRVVRQVTQLTAPSHPSDFAILTWKNEQAWHVVDLLKKEGYSAVHVYDQDGNRDKSKMVRFRKGDGRIKVCTGHSFKGYEIWGAILYVTPQVDALAQARWIYTSMSRAIEGLWVLNTDPKLNEVGEWFPCE